MIITVQFLLEYLCLYHFVIVFWSIGIDFWISHDVICLVGIVNDILLVFHLLLLGHLNWNQGCYSLSFSLSHILMLLWAYCLWKGWGIGKDLSQVFWVQGQYQIYHQDHQVLQAIYWTNHHQVHWQERL